MGRRSSWPRRNRSEPHARTSRRRPRPRNVNGRSRTCRPRRVATCRATPRRLAAAAVHPVTVWRIGPARSYTRKRSEGTSRDGLAWASTSSPERSGRRERGPGKRPTASRIGAGDAPPRHPFVPGQFVCAAALAPRSARVPGSPSPGAARSRSARSQDGRGRVDDQLPRVGEIEDRTRDRPDERYPLDPPGGNGVTRLR
jgi:hypothetical protein